MQLNRECLMVVACGPPGAGCASGRPAGLAMVMELADQPRFVHELVERLGMSQPLVSSHLRVLRGARLVGVERHGREAAYSLADQHVAHIVADAVQHSKEES